MRIQEVWKSYQEGGVLREVLKGVTVSMASGEFTAIIGRSGSGKSSLLNLISGIDRVDSGSIHLNGHEITSLSERDRTLYRRQNIGFIFQFFNLIPTLTVLENVSLPLKLNQTNSADARECSLDLLSRVGLQDRSNTYPERLSGGEQQRVAIARALVHDPALVLADEPTGNLDEESGAQVLELLDRLTRQAGRNLILVTHSNENALLADRVLELRDGALKKTVAL